MRQRTEAIREDFHRRAVEPLQSPKRGRREAGRLEPFACGCKELRLDELFMFQSTLQKEGKLQTIKLGEVAVRAGVTRWMS